MDATSAWSARARYARNVDGASAAPGGGRPRRRPRTSVGEADAAGPPERAARRRGGGARGGGGETGGGATGAAKPVRRRVKDDARGEGAASRTADRAPRKNGPQLCLVQSVLMFSGARAAAARRPAAHACTIADLRKSAPKSDNRPAVSPSPSLPRAHISSARRDDAPVSRILAPVLPRAIVDVASSRSRGRRLALPERRFG
jgi:hypothetical protein